MSNTFDARASTWDEDPGRLQLAADIFSAIEKQIPLQPGFAALDYGCGTGLLTFALAPRVRRITAVDSSRGMLDRLAQKQQSSGLLNIDLLQSDFSTHPLPSGAYDLLTTAMTLHHVANVEQILRQFFSLLAPGGFLALADLDTEDGTFHSNSEGIHHFGFDRGTLARQLEACGFGNLHFTTASRIQKHGRTYPVFLATAQKHQ